MVIPDYYAMLTEILRFFADAGEHYITDLQKYIAQKFRLYYKKRAASISLQPYVQNSIFIVSEKNNSFAANMKIVLV